MKIKFKLKQKRILKIIRCRNLINLGKNVRIFLM